MAGPDRRPSRPSDMRCHSRGIALILVLWVLTLLTVMAVGMTAAQRTETALTENQIGDARFRALADAAIAYAMYSFLLPAEDSLATSPDLEGMEPSPWIPNGAARSWTFAGDRVSITVSNEQSRISLNHAQPDLLAALMIALGVSEEDAAGLGDAISDWRDEDDLRLLNGAEDDEYADAGRAPGAKDAPFMAVEELQQVLGITRELYRRLAPELTVDVQGDSVDQAFASAPVLAALQGILLEEAELQVQERDSPILTGTQGPQAVNRGGPLYRIGIKEQGDGANSRGMEALVELAAGSQPPYLVHWRRFGLVDALPPEDTSDGGND